MPQIMKPNRAQVGGPMPRNFQQGRPQNYVRSNRPGNHPQGGPRAHMMNNQGPMQQLPGQPQQMMAQEMMQHQQQPQPQPPMEAMTPQQIFIRKNQEIFNAIVPENPKYKEIVGNNLYDFILQQVGQQKAPKVTGMLIDLNIDEIRNILQNWDLFITRVKQASELLDRQSPQ